jgi:hypothetical protein
MMAEKKDGLNYISQLDLNRDPFSRLIQGDEIIVLVIGETGSGKTSLLKRYLTASIAGWKTGRIRIQPEARTEPDQPALFKDNEVDSYPAYFLQDIKDSIIIIDDAHELSSRHLTFMLKNAPLSNGGGNVKRFILFGEPQLIDAVNALTASLGNEAAISKIFVVDRVFGQRSGHQQDFRPADDPRANHGLFELPACCRRLCRQAPVGGVIRKKISPPVGRSSRKDQQHGRSAASSRFCEKETTSERRFQLDS